MADGSARRVVCARRATVVGEAIVRACGADAVQYVLIYRATRHRDVIAPVLRQIHCTRPRRTDDMASPTTVGSTGRTPRAGASPSAISGAMIAGMTMETAIPLPRSSLLAIRIRPTTACLVASMLHPSDAILPATEPG